MVMPKQKGSIDIEVGQRIRSLRLRKRLSQTKLAQGLDVTFQQIQKYENGTNRISPDRLERAAKMLDTTVASFFPSMDRETNNSPADFAVLQNKPSMAIMQAFSAIQDHRVRAALVALLQALGKEQRKLQE